MTGISENRVQVIVKPAGNREKSGNGNIASQKRPRIKNQLSPNEGSAKRFSQFPASSNDTINAFLPTPVTGDIASDSSRG